MGSYSHLTIDGYPTFSYKNQYIGELVNLIFQPEDYIVEKRPYSQMNQLVWGDAYKDKKGEFTFRGFHQTVEVCRRRLEIFGASLQRVRANWPNARQIAGEIHYDNAEYDFPINRVSFKNYYNELSKIIRSKIINYDQERDTLQNSLIADELMVSGQNLVDSLYAILSAVDEDDIVEYDLSEIYHGGWIKNDAPSKIQHEKIIILTEGKTDAEFLNKSLKVLYPYLHPYYHFMDFGGYKVEGSASALVKTIRAFAAASVKHPIIALFDNDTAGIAEMKKLPLDLPSNIIALRLPDIKIAKKYPTIGPSGTRRMNINGCACGIELYLGSTILSQAGTLSRIRWTNFDQSSNQYHGSLENKEDIQNVFRQKIRNEESWEMPEMEILLNIIFNSFQTKRKK